MDVLFIHQNFPGQYKFLAPAIAKRGHRVTAMSMEQKDRVMPAGIRFLRYAAARGTTPGVHPWVGDLETKVIRGEACFRTCLKLRSDGYRPDVVIAHPGWGESLFLKDVWPQARLGIYCEFYYHARGADVGFDPEFPAQDEGDACRLRLKNLNYDLHFGIADCAISPTHWQASTYPKAFRDRIDVIHDGIDTNHLAPNPKITLSLNERLPLSRADEIITFVNRNLEPYRGYHIFMRALPELLARRPKARVILVGGDGLSYGAAPKPGKSWKQIFTDEVRPQISDADWARVHFVGKLDYAVFVALLQVSTVHVYLTYPFVLSWSLLEAMSLGCAIVASDTSPVREAITDRQTGRLVDFFDVPGLAQTVCELLDDPSQRARLGAAAREHARATYDLKTVCLPRQLEWFDRLAAATARQPPSMNDDRVS